MTGDLKSAGSKPQRFIRWTFVVGVGLIFCLLVGERYAPKYFGGASEMIAGLIGGALIVGWLVYRVLWPLAILAAGLLYIGIRGAVSLCLRGGARLRRHRGLHCMLGFHAACDADCVGNRRMHHGLDRARRRTHTFHAAANFPERTSGVVARRGFAIRGTQTQACRSGTGRREYEG